MLYSILDQKSLFSLLSPGIFKIQYSRQRHNTWREFNGRLLLLLLPKQTDMNWGGVRRVLQNSFSHLENSLGQKLHFFTGQIETDNWKFLEPELVLAEACHICVPYNSSQPKDFCDRGGLVWLREVSKEGGLLDKVVNGWACLGLFVMVPRDAFFLLDWLLGCITTSVCPDFRRSHWAAG